MLYLPAIFIILDIIIITIVGSYFRHRRRRCSSSSGTLYITGGSFVQYHCFERWNQNKVRRNRK